MATALSPASALTIRLERMLRMSIAALLLVTVACFAFTAPAGAHAVLVAADPADGAVFPSSPTEVAFTFNESISVGVGGIAVLNERGQRVDLGVVSQPTAETVRVALRPELPAGSYLAGYRVVSADGHVVSGAVVFGVGGEVDRAALDGLDVGDDAATAVLGLLGGVLLFGGVLLGLGLAVFMVFVMRPEMSIAPGSLIVALASSVGALGALGVVAARAGQSTGRGLGALAELGVLTGVLGEANTGWWMAAMTLGLVLVSLGAFAAERPLRTVLVAGGAVVTATSFALTGHTVTGSPAVLFGAADAIHVLVGAVWVGGLVGLAIVLSQRGPRSGSATAGRDAGGSGGGQEEVARAQIAVVRRFSTVAAGSVLLLWVTGAIQAWLTVGTPGALATTGYGRLLLLKAAVVILAIGIAAWNRWRLVPRLDEPTEGSTQSPGVARVRVTLRRTVGAEVVLLAVVVVLSSLLVETAPAGSPTGSGPFNETVAVADGLDLNLWLAPGSMGVNEIHLVFIDDNGRLDDRVTAVVVNAGLDGAGVQGADIGPLELAASVIGPGHFIVRDANLPIAGTWRMEVVTRFGPFDQQRTTLLVPIHG